MRLGVEIEPIREARKLVRRQPARLAEVVTVRPAADLFARVEAGVR
jgi:hypothetical protein